MALAYLITFTTYGTWLHGSKKGSVDDAHNEYGSSLVEEDAALERRGREAMKQPPYSLGLEQRQIVCDSIVALATERGWNLLAVHVRTNHVHVVIAAEFEPERLMSDMKARASHELTQRGHGDADRKRWTRHGSTRHLFEEIHVLGAVHYTLDEQGDRMAYWEKPPPDRA